MDVISQEKESKEAGCCGRSHGIFHAWKIVWFFLAAVILVSLIGSGMAMSRFHRYGSDGRGIGVGGCSFGRQFGEGRGDNLAGKGFGRGQRGGFTQGRGMMFGNYQNGESLVGNILKVEGNKITIVDNGNQEKTLISSSTTQIISTDGQAVLKSLTPGLNIEAIGSKDTTGQFTPAIIKVLTK